MRLKDLKVWSMFYKNVLVSPRKEGDNMIMYWAELYNMPWAHEKSLVGMISEWTNGEYSVSIGDIHKTFTTLSNAEDFAISVIDSIFEG